MTKKNIRPQQVAPVARETNTTSKDQGIQVTPSQPLWLTGSPAAQPW